jgi:tetratricopeptide (TPR) repeat protein
VAVPGPLAPDPSGNGDHRAASASREAAGPCAPLRDGLSPALAELKRVATKDLDYALEVSDQIVAANPRSAVAAAARVALLRQAGRMDEARQSASAAIRLALTSGAGNVAFDVFRAVASEADRLGLEPSVFEQLARVLAQRGDFAGASWCVRATAAAGAEATQVDRGLIAVAEAAERAGQPEQALRIFESVAAHRPESELALHARDAARLLRRKHPAIGAGASP